MEEPAFANTMVVIAYASAIVGIVLDGFELLSSNDIQYTPFAVLFLLFTPLYIFSLEFNTLVKNVREGSGFATLERYNGEND